MNNRYQFSTNVLTIPPLKIPADEVARIFEGKESPNDVTGENPSWAWSAGGVISKTLDLALYVQRLVGGGYLSPEWQAKRLASVRPTDPTQPNAPEYGWNLVKFHDDVYGHSGNSISSFKCFA
jgi:D-alanyl-D-alanine carboxypeptidase